QDRRPHRRAGTPGRGARAGLRDHGRLHDQLLACDRAGVAHRAPRRLRRPRRAAVAERRPRRRRGHARRPAAARGTGAVGWRHSRQGRARRMRAGRGLMVACLLLLAGCASRPQPQQPSAVEARNEADTLIHGGLLFDGGDGPGRSADIAIRGDRILEVGPGLRRRYRAAREIDASGHVVSPGLIDPHTHPDTYLRSQDPAMRRLLPWLHQGVSTIFIGIDGGGTPDIAAERAALEAAGTGTNVAAYVGLGPVRRRVLGHDARAPDDAELARMRGLVANAMCEGAFGLSAGLFYAPQSFASTDEV